MQIFSFDQKKIIVDCESSVPEQGGYLLSGSNIALTLPETPRYFYQHGWQSWSLATWMPPQALPVQKPELYHPLQIDPLYARHPSPHGNWLGAVDFDDGNILLLGALGLDAHVQLREGKLQGWYEAGQAGSLAHKWFVGYGHENDVFSAYAQLLGQKFGHGRVEQPYRVWCSWYSLYTAIDEQILSKTFQALGDLPFDVLQVDDGWQIKVGDWQANEKFPAGMEALANTIKASRRKAGLWLAPLIAVKSSQLFRQHPNWFVRDEKGQPISAGFNWGEPLHALDTTHPAVLDWLAALMKQVRAWGFDYLKLDFLYGGALPGKRHADLPREAAYRQGLVVLREAMGEDAYFLTCGAPILPSLGLCDAMRIGPDVAALWENERDAHILCNPTTPGTKNAIRTTLHRRWLAPLLHTDPDVAFFRSQNTALTPEQNTLLQDLAYVCGFKATSDQPQWWTEAEREAVRTFLEQQPAVEQTGRYTFRLDGRAVDFSPAMDLPLVRKKSLSTPFFLWGGEQRWILEQMDKQDKDRYAKLRASLLEKRP
jgi:alpha-galactosidase